MFELSIPILLAVSVICSWLTSLFRGTYSKRTPDNSLYLWIFNFLQNIFCLTGISAIYLVSDEFGSFSIFSVVLGLLIGIMNVLGLNSSLKAMSIGPFSYTSVICSLSAIIPTLSGLFFGESISLFQFFGILMMIVCIILSPDDKKNDTSQKASGKWLFFCLVAALFSGLLGVVQKIHQNSPEHRGEMAALLTSCFAVSTVFSVIKLISRLRKAKSEFAEGFNISKKLLILPICTGLTFAFPHTINLFLAGKLPSIIFFPIVNLTPMILLIISSVVFFKEKLSVKRWCGIGIGILSTVFLSGIIG